jgi:hypothetical protein
MFQNVILMNYHYPITNEGWSKKSQLIIEAFTNKLYTKHPCLHQDDIIRVSKIKGEFLIGILTYSRSIAALRLRTEVALRIGALGLTGLDTLECRQGVVMLKDSKIIIPNCLPY